jgi:hypothetical protein
MRQLNTLEEQLNDYQHEFHQATSRLVDYVQSFYHDLPYGSIGTLNDQFQQTFEEFNWQIRQQDEQLDEARDQERRYYARKLDE